MSWTWGPERLRCVDCGTRNLKIKPDVLECRNCGRGYAIVDGIYYYNFSLEELYALIAQAGYSVANASLFYFRLPRWARLLQRLTRIDRLTLETLTYRFLSPRAWRIYIDAVKT